MFLKIFANVSFFILIDIFNHLARVGESILSEVKAILGTGRKGDHKSLNPIFALTSLSLGVNKKNYTYIFFMCMC